MPIWTDCQDRQLQGQLSSGRVGKNELFSTKWNRLKIDGLLSFSLGKISLGETVRFFLEMQVDNDVNDGPDSVRTFFGIDVDLKSAFGGI
jgi:hypothetical protein